MWRQHVRSRFLAWADVVLLVIVAYAPFLLSSPGRISSDTKQALYVDPGSLLREAPFMWDPSVAAGTVPHQRIGYLWPMGPWFWSFDLVGAPVWLAQRLWLGTIAVLAALGVRWLVRSLGLGRSAALAAALVYVLAPYQLAFTARMSVLLLPMAALPWLVELARRSVHHGGWRHPALFGLVATTASGVNAPALLLVGIAPLLVVLAALFQGSDQRRRAIGAGTRIAVFLVPLSAWWISGLALQSTYGMPILDTTEPLSAVASRSSPDDVLRGLGNWFFYGRDRSGWSVVQAEYYDAQTRTVLLSLLVPMAALAGAAVLRWRWRALVVAVATVAVVGAVGPWPYGHPSPFGRVFRWITEQTSAGMAFRNSPRIVPVLILAYSVLLGAVVAALPRLPRRATAAGVSLLAVAGLSPVLVTGMFSEGVERPTTLPTAWTAAAEHLDGSGSTGRVLELPGANFADHRWGNTVEPILPLLLDRPHLSREVLPYGTAGSALLLDALDRRLQNGVLEAGAVAPVARLLGVEDLVVRSDLRHELFSLARPDQVWGVLVDPPAPGLGAPVPFGDPVVDAPDRRISPIAPSELRADALAAGPRSLPPVVVLPVSDPVGVVRVAPVDRSVVLDGDADGIVDAAGSGLIDGRALLLLAAGLDDDELAREVDAEASLVVTDSNRRRIQTWFTSIVTTRGPTERLGAVEVEPTGTDGRLQVFPEAGDGSHTVVEHLGATVSGTSGGGAARPEDRAVAAFDGRESTSWRVGGPDPAGASVTATFDVPRAVDRLLLLQPQDGPRDRVVTRAALTFDDGDRIELDLGEESLSPPGEVVTFPSRTARAITVEVIATSDPGFDPALANAVGFAEIGVDGLVVEEAVRMPTDLLDRTGRSGHDRSLDLVMVRLRTDPDEWGRSDDEGRLDRTFDLPTERSFGLVGTARPSSLAPDHLIDELLGTSGAVTFSSSGRLQADPLARASRAFDRRADTAWTSPLGDDSVPWLAASGADPISVGPVSASFLADDLHSLPAAVSLVVDGEVVARAAPNAADAVDGRLTVALDPPAGTAGREIRLQVDETSARTSPTDDPAGVRLPVAVAEVSGLGIDPAPTTPQIPDTCRDDLLALDGAPVAVRLAATADPRVLAVEACDPLDLGSGTHRAVAPWGDETGVDVDSLVWSSAPGGAASSPAIRGTDLDRTPAQIVDVRPGRMSTRATIEAEGEPFWFVLGQSSSDGWSLRVDGASVGDRVLADGHTDAWLLTPDGAGTVVVHATWSPQRLVWWALAVTLAAVLAAIAVIVRTSPAQPVPPVPGPTLRWPADRAGPPSSLAVASIGALITGVVVLAMSRPWIAAVAALAALVVGLVPVAAWAVAVLAPLTLLGSRALDRPELGWLALAWVVAAVVADVLRERRAPAP